jgi:Na+-driven multidrug efflux pump
LNYVNTLLAGGTSRFLTIQLGKGNLIELKKTFSTALFLCLCSAIIILLFGETIGLWFVNNKLNVEPDRIEALNWVYQSALLTAALTVIQSPFTASVISHEKMNVYAIISILDSVAKFGLITLLLFCRQTMQRWRHLNSKLTK